MTCHASPTALRKTSNGRDTADGRFAHDMPSAGEAACLQQAESERGGCAALVWLGAKKPPTKFEDSSADQDGGGLIHSMGF